jgi:hypothetical protein
VLGAAEVGLNHIKILNEKLKEALDIDSCLGS